MPETSSKYVREETLKDGTVVGYLPDNNWEVITYGSETGINKNPVSQLSTDDGEEILDQQTKKFETQYGFKDETVAGINPSQDPNFVPDPTKNYDVFGNVVGDKPKETKETGYTFEEAQEIWGNDFTGIKRGEDGQFYPDSSAYERAGIKGLETDDKSEDLTEEVDETDQLIEDEYNKWQDYNVETDPAYIDQINSISAQYDTLRRQMQQKNESRQRAIETMGYRHGTRQYAGAIQLGIEGEELKQAGQRLTDIATEELAAKSAARIAFENNEYTKFSQKVDALQTIRNNKADALEKYNNALIATNEAMTEAAKEEREAEKDERERQETTTENLADIALANMTGDAEVDMAFLKGLADEYGIDPNFLSSAVAKLQTKMESDLMTSDIKEYRLAVSQGYDKTFKEWQKEQKGEELVSGGGGSKWRLNTETGKYEMVIAPIYAPTGGGGDDGETLTAGQVRDIKYLTTAPNWFRKKIEDIFDKQFQTPTEATIQKEWEAMKEEKDVDKEEIVWAWLATLEAQALSDEEKKSFIMSYGLDPEKFNIY